MTVSRYDGNQWSPTEIVDTSEMSFHPGTHAFHYGSCCFEGLKAYRWENGENNIYRLDRHVVRMQRSAELTCLPVPNEEQLTDAIKAAVTENLDQIPSAPGSLYLRPTLIGTDVNIGKASTPSDSAMLFIVASPVGDYFSGGLKPLTVLVDDESMRSTPEFGMAKAGGNYAAALRIIESAKKTHGADQVLFCPGGDVQETGAANFLLINENSILTKSLDGSFLHGITRDSILTIAKDMGYKVEERDFTVDEMLEWTSSGEAALSGTAAVLAGVGKLIYQGAERPVGDGDFGKHTRRLRDALVAIQSGTAPDTHGWLTRVG